MRCGCGVFFRTMESLQPIPLNFSNFLVLPRLIFFLDLLVMKKFGFVGSIRRKSLMDVVNSTF